MGTHERRRRDRETLRRRILDAARDLFVAEGFEAVTLRKIAAAVEYSPTAIYLYFADKEAILTALIEEGFHLLVARLRQTDGIASPVERLRAGGREYFAFARAEPNYYAIMFEMRAHPLGRGHTPAEQAAHGAFGYIARAVTEAMASGALPAGRAGQEAILAHVYWASLHGAASLLLSGRLTMLPDATHDDLLETTLENCLRGMINEGNPGHVISTELGG